MHKLDHSLIAFMRDFNCDERTAKRYRELTSDGVYPWHALIITGLETVRA